MIWRLKQLWRRLTRACIYCGNRPRVAANPNDVYARRLNACRKCNKVFSFGELYGMGRVNRFPREGKTYPARNRIIQDATLESRLSFLYGVTVPPGCRLTCHDSNHNGDDHPGRSCGNPKCWKHGPDAPPPKFDKQIPGCTCEFGETK